MPESARIILQAGQGWILPPKSVDQLFLMVLCGISSAVIISGEAPAPGTIESSMPFWMVTGWAVSLGVGAFVVIMSYLVKDRVTSMIVEQFGSVCLAAAAVLYGVLVLLFQFRTGGAIPGILILGFAFTRAYQAQYYQKVLKNIRTVIATAPKEGGVDGAQR